MTKVYWVPQTVVSMYPNKVSKFQYLNGHLTYIFRVKTPLCKLFVYLIRYYVIG